MYEALLSLGMDLGTTSTQLILSRLGVENRASGFAVPELAITSREILYQSPVHFTPLLRPGLVDGDALRQLVLEEYRRAGLCREDIDTGAIIVTGETSRAENAREAARALENLAGDFVVATAGPDLESALAARGSGAVEFSERTGKTVLHIDIGGGTSNLALIRSGSIEKTGCLNVGGRLVKLDEQGIVTYVSPALSGLTQLQVGDRPGISKLEALAGLLTQGLEMAAGLRPETELLVRLSTREAREVFQCWEKVTLSFSGGVAECIRNRFAPLKFGDMGPILGQAIRESPLCRGEYRIGDQPIRATVIGAGCHSAQLSGSTVFHQNIPFPLKNLPVRRPGEPGPEGISVLALPGPEGTGYAGIATLAEKIAEESGPMVLVCLERDAAQALGQRLALNLGREKPILCIDGIRLPPGSYLDVGAPVGPALPVVVKTLIWKEGQSHE